MHTILRNTLTIVSFVLPFSALAHETQQFRMGETVYQFTVGSLNEPIIVDDKSGVDLRVAHLSATGASTPVVGLEETLKVELRSGGAAKEIALETQYGQPGAYKAVFYPTSAAELTYRIFGMLEGNDVDLTFTCHPSGHHMTGEPNAAEVQISPTVTRVLQRGSFGCPGEKASLGFPDDSVALADIHDTDGSFVFSMAAIALALAALSLSVRKARP